MRLQARWSAAAQSYRGSAAASAALPPSCSSFASGGSLLLRQKAQHRSGRRLVLGTEARDGKKRRKPQQTGSRDSGSSSEEEVLAPARAPPRVDPNSNIPAKHQIRWAKQYKEYTRQASLGFQQTPARAFRQESLDPEEHRRWAFLQGSLGPEGHRRQREAAERIAEQARKRKSDMVTLQAMFHTNVTAAGEQPLGVTLIDGYNLLFRWAGRDSGVAQWMELSETPGMLAEAREWLLGQLDLYSHLRGMYIHVVYDAMNVGYSSQYNTNGMIVSYRGNETADSYILRQAKLYGEQGVPKVCIVSDDMEISLLGPDVVPRFPGQAVFSTSCSALIQLVKDSQAEALSLVGRMEALHPSHGHLSPFSRSLVRSKAHHGVARQQGSGSGSGSGSGGGGGGAPPARGLGNLSSLRRQLAEKEKEEAHTQEAQRRQQRQRQRQVRAGQQQGQAQQAQPQQQPDV